MGTRKGRMESHARTTTSKSNRTCTYPVHMTSTNHSTSSCKLMDNCKGTKYTMTDLALLGQRPPKSYCYKSKLSFPPRRSSVKTLLSTGLARTETSVKLLLQSKFGDPLCQSSKQSLLETYVVRDEAIITFEVSLFSKL